MTTFNTRDSATRVAEAIHYAVQAHGDQTRRAPDGDGTRPYAVHVIRVVLRCPREYQVVAALHDVLEDTDAGLPHWLTEDEAKAVRLLTRDKETQTYAEYIEALVADNTWAGILARYVKVEDLLDNMSDLTVDDSLYKRYLRAYRRIMRP